LREGHSVRARSAVLPDRTAQVVAARNTATPAVESSFGALEGRGGGETVAA
jgi:hypothetical protein